MIDGCERPHNARGYCSTHYRKWQLYGDPLADFTPVRGLCTVFGCERLHDAKGYCSFHYNIWKRYGDPLASIRIHGDDWLRFMSHVEITPTHWLWNGTINRKGYGSFCYGLKGNRRTRGAHIFAYEHFNGPMPKGLEIDHLCRVRNCVFPDHLEAVTHQENIIRGHAARKAGR